MNLGVVLELRGSTPEYDPSHLAAIYGVMWSTSHFVPRHQAVALEAMARLSATHLRLRSACKASVIPP